jgi:hypothetical protein
MDFRMSQHYTLFPQAQMQHQEVLRNMVLTKRRQFTVLIPALIGCLPIPCVKGREWGLDSCCGGVGGAARGRAGLRSGGDHGTANGQKNVCRCRFAVVQVIYSLSHSEDRSCSDSIFPHLSGPLILLIPVEPQALLLLSSITLNRLCILRH